MLKVLSRLWLGLVLIGVLVLVGYGLAGQETRRMTILSLAIIPFCVATALSISSVIDDLVKKGW